MSRLSRRPETLMARENRTERIAAKQYRGNARYWLRGYVGILAPPCDDTIFQRGRPLLSVSTGATGGADIFEAWTLRLSDKMRLDKACSSVPLRRVIDWHYSGGRAQVLVHPAANFDAVRAYVQSAIRNEGLPTDPRGSMMTVLEWLSGDGLYRAGVTELPDGVIAVF